MEQPPEQPPDQPRARNEHDAIRALCWHCRGEGAYPKPTMAVIGHEIGTMYSMRRCHVCAGRGWLDGLRIPV